MCFSTKKLVLKTFFHLALAVIFHSGHHPSNPHLVILSLEFVLFEIIAHYPLVRVFNEGFLSLRVSSIPYHIVLENMSISINFHW